jgi:hypothetical protein
MAAIENSLTAKSAGKFTALRQSFSVLGGVDHLNAPSLWHFTNNSSDHQPAPPRRHKAYSRSACRGSASSETVKPVVGNKTPV